MKLHFIAIGGSAMHNLAIALHEKGDQITGSDDEIFEPSASRLARYHLLPERMGWFPDKIHAGLDAVILGMHARADNPELLAAQELGVKIYSYPEFLYQQSKEKKRIVIGGSHGKTTITAMILHILKAVNKKVDYMVGAQLEGFEVMVRLTHDAEWMIMEGDEYLTSPLDRSPKFLHYRPHLAIISGIGWDHVNVFPTFETYLQQFSRYIEAIEPGGCLIYNAEDAEVQKLADQANCRKLPYTTHPFVLADGATTITSKAGMQLSLSFFGKHNLSNMSAAFAVCREMGVDEEDGYRAIASFKGASRRLECLASNSSAVLYRDFAHAPSKVKASTEALRQNFPNHQLIVCFELHTFSSLSADFIHHYTGSVDAADRVIVFYDPHAVALKKLKLMEAEQIKAAFGRDDLMVLSDPEAMIRWIKENITFPTVVALMSSGSFRGLNIETLKEVMKL